MHEAVTYVKYCKYDSELLCLIITMMTQSYIFLMSIINKQHSESIFQSTLVQVMTWCRQTTSSLKAIVHFFSVDAVLSGWLISAWKIWPSPNGISTQESFTPHRLLRYQQELLVSHSSTREAVSTCRWVKARKTYLQCVSNGVTSFLRSPIEVQCISHAAQNVVKTTQVVLFCILDHMVCTCFDGHCSYFNISMA